MQRQTILKTDIEKFLRRGWAIVGMFDDFYTVERPRLHGIHDLQRIMREVGEDLGTADWSKESNASGAAAQD